MTCDFKIVDYSQNQVKKVLINYTNSCTTLFILQFKETDKCEIVNNITLMAEREKELNSLLMEVREESEKAGLKLSIQKMKILAPGPLLQGNQMGVKWKQ